MYCEKKTITKSYKEGRGGGAQVYVLSDLGNSSREIPVFNFQGIKLIFFSKDWVLVQTDIKMQ